MRSSSTRTDARPIEALATRLDALATEKSRAFWERYLKGVVPFRGVPMASIRKAVHAWWRSDGPSALGVPAQKELALRLFEGGFCEDKLAGTLVLQEILLSELTLRDVDALGSLFDRWLLRELAAADRARVLAFTEDRLGEMSREAVRYVVERMPKSVQARVVSRHKLAGER
jgi:hypothetical protein